MVPISHYCVKFLMMTTLFFTANFKNFWFRPYQIISEKSVWAIFYMKGLRGWLKELIYLGRQSCYKSVFLVATIPRSHCYQDRTSDLHVLGEGLRMRACVQWSPHHMRRSKRTKGSMMSNLRRLKESFLESKKDFTLDFCIIYDIWSHPNVFQLVARLMNSELLWFLLLLSILLDYWFAIYFFCVSRT